MNDLSDMFPLTTERLALRMLTLDEAELILRYYRENKKHLASWEPIRSEKFYTVEFWQKSIENTRQEFLNDRSMRLVFSLKTLPDRTIIGVTNFNTIVRGVFQACYLGYSIDYRYQGQSLMYEALKKAIDFAFEHLRLHRIMANYIPRNERSGKLLRKLRFVREGYACDYLKIAGKWEDHILTSLIRPEK